MRLLWLVHVGEENILQNILVAFYGKVSVFYDILALLPTKRSVTYMAIPWKFIFEL